MKIDRLMGILTLLLRQDRVTAPQLAQRFEVSRRTINRDIEDLCRAGIPVVTVQGYGGGLSIADGYKIDATLLTREELQAVLAGLRGLDSVSAEPRFPALADKLSGKHTQIVADETLVIDLASHYSASLIPKLESIKAAIQTRRVVSFWYYYEKGESRRVIEPYRLVFRWSSWYVFGYCRKRRAFRLFKLSRLWDLCVTDELFSAREIPQELFSFDEHFTESALHLKAVFDAGEKHRLIDEYGMDCFTVCEDGGLLFEWDYHSYTAMREWIFSFGDKVTVLEPAALREDRLLQAQRIVAAALSATAAQSGGSQKPAASGTGKRGARRGPA